MLGPDYYAYPHRYCHVREPGGDAQNMYQDAGGVTCRDESQWLWRHHPRVAMLFYYPQDTPAVLGPTAVLRGSQYYNRRIDGDESNELALEGQAGTATIVHYDLWHRAMANRSEWTRYMMTFLFVRMSDPQHPAWNCCRKAWESAFDGGKPDRRDLMWAHFWYWHFGEKDRRPAAGSKSAQVSRLIESLDDPPNRSASIRPMR